MDLNDVFSDKPIVTVDEPEKTEPDQSTDVKAEESDTAAPSAATESKDDGKTEAKAEDKPEDKPSPQRDEKGRFAKTEDKPEPMVPLSALLAERAKRKDPEQKPKTSIFDDEDKGVSERVEAYVNPLEQKVMSLELRLARKDHPDFDDAVMAFLKDAQNDPVLRYQADNAPEPLEFIYREGKRRMELAEVGGDIGKYREKVLAEANAKYAELETRFKALESENRQLKESLNKREKVPQSLNSEPSASAKDVTFTGPTPLSQVFN